ncbi:MAG: hypothetical protein ACON5K_07205 [Bacteroidia bacterium]
MIKKVFIIISLMLSSCSTSQQFINDTKLYGRWLLEGNYDCPDMLEFKKNNVYIIYNDCGAEDPTSPIVEIGNWKLKDNFIVLYNRDFRVKNSDFSSYHGVESEFLFKVKEITANKMKLTFENQKINSIEEIYTKK